METLIRHVVGNFFSKRIRKTPCLLETSEYVIANKLLSKLYLLGITDFGNLDKSGGLFFSLAIDTNFKGDPSGVVGLVDGGSIVSDLLFTKEIFLVLKK